MLLTTLADLETCSESNSDAPGSSGVVASLNITSMTGSYAYSADQYTQYLAPAV